MKSFVSAFALALSMPAVALAAPPQSPGAAPTAADADAFVAQAEREGAAFSVFGQQVSWVNNTYITDDTDAINARVGAEGTELGVRYAKGAARFIATPGLTPDTRRKLDLMRQRPDAGGTVDPGRGGRAQHDRDPPELRIRARQGHVEGRRGQRIGHRGGDGDRPQPAGADRDVDQLAHPGRCADAWRLCPAGRDRQPGRARAGLCRHRRDVAVGL